MDNNQGDFKQRNFKNQAPIPLWFILAAIGIMLVIQNLLFVESYKQIPYSEFRLLLREDKIKEVQIGSQRIHGTLRPTSQDATGGRGVEHFMTVRVEDKELIADLQKHAVTYSGRYESDFIKNLMLWLIRHTEQFPRHGRQLAAVSH